MGLKEDLGLGHLDDFQVGEAIVRSLQKETGHTPAYLVKTAFGLLGFLNEIRKDDDLAVVVINKKGQAVNEIRLPMPDESE